MSPRPWDGEAHQKSGLAPAPLNLTTPARQNFVREPLPQLPTRNLTSLAISSCTFAITPLDPVCRQLLLSSASGRQLGGKMKETNRLRLRLVVRRHGLPETRVVFNAALDDDPTISKLLEQVNDVVPLEAGDWGLEDYVVELGNAAGDPFECFHFYQVAAVLDKDDEVL